MTEIMPIGLLKWRLDYARSSKEPPGGIFLAIKNQFSELVKSDLAEILNGIYDFRNQYLAHQEKVLNEAEIAHKELITWVDGSSKLCGLAQT
jgi:type III restriction enzyme